MPLRTCCKPRRGTPKGAVPVLVAYRRQDLSSAKRSATCIVKPACQTFYLKTKNYTFFREKKKTNNNWVNQNKKIEYYISKRVWIKRHPENLTWNSSEHLQISRASYCKTVACSFQSCRGKGTQMIKQAGLTILHWWGICQHGLSIYADLQQILYDCRSQTAVCQ